MVRDIGKYIRIKKLIFCGKIQFYFIYNFRQPKTMFMFFFFFFKLLTKSSDSEYLTVMFLSPKMELSLIYIFYFE